MGDYQMKNAEKSKLASNSGHLLPEEFYSGKGGITLDGSMKAVSAFGSGLAEGTLDKAMHFATSIYEKPVETLWHVGSGAAIGIGLAMANKRLAAIAGAAGTCEMLIRGFSAGSKSFDSMMNLATTGTGYENAKKSVSSNFGQIGADMLAMTASGALAGGITHGVSMLRSIKTRQPVAHLQVQGGDMENAPISAVTWPKIGHSYKDFDEKALWESLATPKKTADLVVRSAKEAEHESTGLNFLNKKSPFVTETPALTEGMSPVQIMSAMHSDSKANNKHLDWALTRLVDKFTHGSHGTYAEMSAKGQSEMIDNLVQVSRNVSRSETAHGVNLTSLSKVHQLGGRHQQEVKLLEKAQQIFDAESTTLGHTPELKMNLQRLADAYTAIGEPALAISTAERLVQTSSTGKITEKINALNNLGKVCNNLGATDRSLDAYESAMEIGRTIKTQPDLKLFAMPNSKNLSELHQFFSEASEFDNAKRCLKIMEFWNS